MNITTYKLKISNAKFYFTTIILLVIGLQNDLKSQTIFHFQNPQLKGPVSRSLTTEYHNSKMDRDGKINLGYAIQCTETFYENSLVTKMNFYSEEAALTSKLVAQIFFSYTQGKLTKLEEYTNEKMKLDPNNKMTLQITSNLYYDINENLDYEMIVDKTNKIIGHYIFEKNQTKSKNQNYTFRSEGSSGRDVNGEYFMEFDKLGLKSKHHKIGNDTVLSFFKTNINENKWSETYVYKNGDNISNQIFEHQIIEKDKYSNPLKIFTKYYTQEKDTSSKITINYYNYTNEKELDIIQKMGGIWINDNKKVKITIQNDPQNLKTGSILFEEYKNNMPKNGKELFIIVESNLWSNVIKSRKPEARKFIQSTSDLNLFNIEKSNSERFQVSLFIQDETLVLVQNDAKGDDQVLVLRRI